MSWEEDKEYTESKPQHQHEPYSLWKKTRKYIAVGVICFIFGFSFTSYHSTELKERNSKLNEENRELKHSLKNLPVETVLVPYTVPVYVTETVKSSKEVNPVTDIPTTETSDLMEAETDEYQIKVLTNPLTKAQPYKVKPPKGQYTIYWIEIKRSDLASLTSSDFLFFLEYINKEYNTDESVYFYIRMTDFTNIMFDCPIYDGNIKKDTLYVCQPKYDKTDKCYRNGYISCEMNIGDPDKIMLTGYKKDEYNLPAPDEGEVYSFSEFNEELWNKLKTMQEKAKFLFG